MSRIGKQPITIPDGVTAKLDGTTLEVKGPKGELRQELPDGVSASFADGELTVTRDSDSRADRSAHGLARSLFSNMVVGVSAGYTRKLIINGVGYRAEVRGERYLLFQLGYSHPILYELPEGISVVVVPKENSVTLTGIDKQMIGAVAAEIRSLRPPEPYKGKGVRYADEVVRRKEGKGAGK